MKIIRKAVFPVAGFGTRFLPATKAMPKELLPIINKPLIQYAVEEAISAGIDTLIFVTGRNKRAIEDHFDSNPELEAILKRNGKFEQADMIRNILPKGIECIFVRQSEQLGLGHAVLCAERAVGDEPFAVLLADDFLIHEGTGTISELIQAYRLSGRSQLSVMPVKGKNISNYGVVTRKKRSKRVTSVIEKPAFKDAPSNLASIGRYVLTPQIFDILRKNTTKPGCEIELTNAINTQAQMNQVEAQELKGIRFDCGSVRGYIDAIMKMAETIDIS